MMYEVLVERPVWTICCSRGEIMINQKPVFKVVVAGSRNYFDKEYIRQRVLFMLSEKMKTHDIEIVSGASKGPDTIGEEIAREQGWRVIRFHPDWEKEGRSAGPKRNAHMAEYADVAIVFNLNNSSGSKNMAQQMEQRHKPVKVYKINSKEKQ
jgi:predicted Rossmann fold nucleotide-binding protein DprA/Smf involved in DNA uptake